MANERADEMHPARLEAIAREIAAETGAAVSVVTGEELSAAGLNMFYAVGQAGECSQQCSVVKGAVLRWKRAK